MIFLTGTSGLVGSHLLELLLLRNETVKALIRKKSDINKFKFDTSKVEWIYGDILDTPILNDALKGVKTVFHCAAMVSYSDKLIDEMFKINVEGTANIVNLSLENKVEKLCYVSSIASLDQDKLTKVTSEKSPFNESNPHSNYAISKYHAELEVWRGIEEGLDTIILNPTIILGPSDWEKSSTKLFKYVWDKHKFYIGGGYNFVDVRDVVQICYETTFSEVKNQQYIVSGTDVNYKNLFEKIAQEFKVKPPSIEAGKTLKTLVLWWSNFRSFFTSKEPIITKDAINKSDKFPKIDNLKIQKDFPHKNFSIDETIRWTCQKLLEK